MESRAIYFGIFSLASLAIILSPDPEIKPRTPKHTRTENYAQSVYRASFPENIQDYNA